MTRAVLRTDGGARGNPGPAAAAFVLEQDGVCLAQGARFLGETTNNVAEYQALVWGLEHARAKGVSDIDVYSDSQLLVRQINGDYKVKHPNLKPLFVKSLHLLREFDSFEVIHVRREENQAADALANDAMDARSDIFEEGCPPASSGSPATLFVPEPEESLAADLSDRTGPEAEGRMYELSVKGHFDAAHAIRGYPGECADLHGHTWDVEVTVAGATLDEIGIVYDFKRLKDDLGRVLERFDHGFLNDVPPFDELNTTAENLARVVFDTLAEQVGNEVQVVSVSVWESPVARITYRRT